ncbi:hypothetical protein Tco_0584026 [Tanacetum coccineum]
MVDNNNDSVVLDKVFKVCDECKGFELKKSSGGKGFEVSDAYVKESIEVENRLVDGVVVEVVTSSIEVANGLADDVVGNKDEGSKECCNTPKIGSQRNIDIWER